MRAQTPTQVKARTENCSTVETIDTRIEQINSLPADLDRQDRERLQAKRAASASDANARYAATQNRLASLRYEESLRLEREWLVGMKHKIESAPACSALFLSTIDSRASDLTVR